MKKSFLLVLLLLLYLLTACATALNSTSQDVEINSNPTNAKIIIDGKKFGTTPNIINLERGVNHVVKLELEGYEAYETQITRKISSWFWGNALNGFIPGMLTDYLTGSMYNLMPTKISAELSAEKQIIKKK